MNGLEDDLRGVYDSLEIGQHGREELGNYLGLLKRKDLSTYEHSIRVGLKMAEVGEFLGDLPVRAYFYPGLLHDVGKIFVRDELLKKVEGFSEEDMEELRAHIFDGYHFVKEKYPFSARVLLYHHAFQKKAYPKGIGGGRALSPGEGGRDIFYLARILGIVDFYDSANNRINTKFGGGTRRLSRREAGEFLRKEYWEWRDFIDEMYSQGIFQ